MALIVCDECGNEYSNKAPACPKCGNPTTVKDTPVIEHIHDEETHEEKHEEVHEEKHEEVHEEEHVEHEHEHVVEHKEEKDDPVTKTKKKNKLLIPIIAGAAVLLIVIIVVVSVLVSKKKEEEKAIRVDITMNSWYGEIDLILEDFGIEFYSVTGGANCYSGTKTNSFETEKYGILYTEFTYCKSSEVQRFRIYNKSSDQELRDPKPGELTSYDTYGYRSGSSSSSGKGL